MGNLFAAATPENLPLFVRGALLLVVVISIYNYVRNRYFGRVIERIEKLGALSPERARSARELGCAGMIYRLWLRRKSTLRKTVLTSAETDEDGGEEDGADSAVGALSEEDEVKRLRRADKVRPEAEFESLKFYIPPRRMEEAKKRFCGKKHKSRGSVIGLAAGCVLLIVLGELFLYFKEPLINLVRNLTNLS